MECILLFGVLGLDICVVLHEQVDQLRILGHHCVVQSTVACFGLLVVDVDCHICSEVLINESCDGIIVSSLGGLNEILALLEITVPPGPPHFLISVLQLSDARRWHLGIFDIRGTTAGRFRCATVLVRDGIFNGGSMVAVALVMCLHHR